MENVSRPAIYSILVVEDDPAIRMMLEDMLEELCANVTLVATADEGLIALQMQSWQLLITDVQTPGKLNGLQLAITAREQRPALEVIVTSGYHNALGMPLPLGVSFLAKPWSLKDFYALVEYHLAK
ncbi:response regulator [Pseudomonas sp. URMO17WK12:I11]|uniref:response regulator n=1 Tax=Pseudomonas sp. URMO17WK12:I11 TaxID=1283291 RepID=UPI0011A6A4FD|nr:response regulator [Pseudomonas sp. URMO17WK12:I11]